MVAVQKKCLILVHLRKHCLCLSQSFRSNIQKLSPRVFCKNCSEKTCQNSQERQENKYIEVFFLFQTPFRIHEYDLIKKKFLLKCVVSRWFRSSEKRYVHQLLWLAGNVCSKITVLTKFRKFTCLTWNFT